MKWISFKDSKPEIGKPVILFNRKYYYFVSLKNELEWEMVHGCCYMCMDDIHNVSPTNYWMPLPEGPEN